MKKLLLALPLLVMGCVHATIYDRPAPTHNLVSVARGTTGAVEYACEQYESDAKGVPFHCIFKNVSDQVQPGASIKVAIYSETNNNLLKESKTIYASYTLPGETSEKYFYLQRSDIPKECGYNLAHCVVLVDRLWPTP